MTDATKTPRLRGLFVSAAVPWPLDGGGRIATLRVLAAFAPLADIDLLAHSDPVRPLDLQPLSGSWRSVVVVPHPFTFSRHRVKQSLAALASLYSRNPGAGNLWAPGIRSLMAPRATALHSPFHAERSFELLRQLILDLV